MAIFAPPDLEADDLRVLAEVDELHTRLRQYSYGTPRRWLGSLRRASFAEAIRGSNSIEGYNVSMDEAIAIVDEEAPQDEKTEAHKAVEGYRLAMTYIMQAATDPHGRVDSQILKSLHFMMTNYDMKNRPGHWRPGNIFVTDTRNNEVVYEGPDAAVVDGLVEELVESIKLGNKGSAFVQGAMAHLNLVMIHPFSDGNGRMSRALQTFCVLSREKSLHPSFCSIEVWLGTNTREYYDILGSVGNGSWNPHRDSLPWVRFCLKAHHQQASRMLRRHEEFSSLYMKVELMVKEKHMPERATLPLFDAAMGHKLTNSRYRAGSEESEFVASRDLKRLCEAGLLEPKGEKRGRTYVAAECLRDAWTASRIRKPLSDPYAIAS